MFRTMSREAASQGEARSIFRDLPGEHRATALRAVQRFLAPLSIAACSMTSVAEVEEFRTILSDMLKGIDTTAAQMEAEAEPELTEDDCDCHERSWYGPVHDTACPLAGRPRR